jgi:hypothetical protein
MHTILLPLSNLKVIATLRQLEEHRLFEQDGVTSKKHVCTVPACADSGTLLQPEGCCSQGILVADPTHPRCLHLIPHTPDCCATAHSVVLSS